jgi:hypothetical protein
MASTTGFSSATADRNVEIVVVADGEAYLGIQKECRNDTSQVMITNRFPAGTTLDVNIAINRTEKTIDELRSGESQSRAFDTFGADETITVHASGSGITVRLTRLLPAGC